MDDESHGASKSMLHPDTMRPVVVYEEVVSDPSDSEGGNGEAALTQSSAQERGGHAEVDAMLTATEAAWCVCSAFGRLCFEYRLRPLPCMVRS